jgi:hypothetical protein
MRGRQPPAGSLAAPLSPQASRGDYLGVLPVPRSPTVSNALTRLRRAVATLAVEDRPNFKRVDASRAVYDDGSWLEPSLRTVTIRPYA